jgi:D-glycero-alpha-D-manno-heptose-7-phosphate kinase
MIVSKCPMRISLAGGSTDLEEYVDSNGYGSVISFPCTLYSYISIFHDKNGYNNFFNKYIINYTSREQVDDIGEIKNDVAREVLDHFKCDPLAMSFHADVFSEGSGLASSSAYLIACIKAVSVREGLSLSELDICNLALKIEKKFNPLTGYQDIYGCGLGDLKRMHFHEGGRVKVQYLKKNIFSFFDMHLVYTGIKRKSTKLLESLDLKKIDKILPLVDQMEKSINNYDAQSFLDIIREGWAKKKETSPMITQNVVISDIDNTLRRDKSVLAHRLCGAGNGGYFLVFKKRDSANELKNSLKIKMAERAIECKVI